jgi:prolyl 4-hydroxylase
MRTLPVAYTHLVNQVESLDPVVNQWLKEALQRGADPDEMVEALVRSGRPLDLASVIVQFALRGRFVSTGMDDRLVGRSIQGSPDVPEAIQHQFEIEGHRVKKRMTLSSLNCVIFDNFLTDEECEHIKAQSASKMKRSAVVGKDFSNVETRIRSSSGTFFDRGADDIISRVERRVAAITNTKVENGEGLQILHYAYAQEYQPHFDFFEPQTESEHAMIAQSGNRMGTMIFYLNEPEEGGSTYFPQMKLSIHPNKGSALWFTYLGADQVPDRRSEHAGLPVIKGEKWIATKWIRERAIADFKQQVSLAPSESAHSANTRFNQNNVVMINKK